MVFRGHPKSLDGGKRPLVTIHLGEVGTWMVTEGFSPPSIIFGW